MTEENPTKDLKDIPDKVANQVIKEVAMPVVKPSVDNLSQSLEIVTGTILTVLKPLKVFINGYAAIEKLIENKLAKKLEGVPLENVVPPKASIAVPTIEALRYTADEEELHELFLNLLASSMNKNESSSALPCFVEIIKQLTSDEAKIMAFFKTKQSIPFIIVRAHENESSFFGINILSKYTCIGKKISCSDLKIVNSYLDNLDRLGLIEINDQHNYKDKNEYNDLKNDKYIKQIEDLIRQRENYNFPKIEEGIIKLTDLGKLFTEICIGDQPIIVSPKKPE